MNQAKCLGFREFILKEQKRIYEEHVENKLMETRLKRKGGFKTKR